jgi:hypothetical protein
LTLIAYKVVLNQSQLIGTEGVYYKNNAFYSFGADQAMLWQESPLGGERQQLCNIRTDRRRDSIHIAYAEGFLDQNTNKERRRHVGGVGEGQPQVYSPPEAGLLRMPVLHVHVVTCSKVEKSGRGCKI